MIKVILIFLITFESITNYGQEIKVVNGDTALMNQISVLTDKTYEDSTIFDLKFDLPEGLYKVYISLDKNPIIEGLFNENRKRDSTWVYRNNHGLIKEKICYDNGKESFRFIYSIDTSNNLDKIGKLSRVYFLDNDLYSNYLEFDSIGHLITQWRYSNGITIITNYFPTGIIESQGKMINGKKDGLWFYFDESGIIIKTLEYKNSNEINTFKF